MARKPESRRKIFLGLAASHRKAARSSSGMSKRRHYQKLILAQRALVKIRAARRKKKA